MSSPVIYLYALLDVYMILSLAEHKQTMFNIILAYSISYCIVLYGLVLYCNARDPNRVAPADF